jgi:Domain of unknown function (DUF2019)
MTIKPSNLDDMTEDRLIERFIEIGIGQDQALLMDQIAIFNRLYKLRKDVELQLQRRSGDRRHVLLQLYDHPNVQVRLNAAEATLAVEPQKARRELEIIASSGQYPQAGYAGMTVAALDRGTFEPS